MSDNNPNIFPLDEFNPDQQKGKNSPNNQQSPGTDQNGISQSSEDPILFPLDEYQVTQPAPAPKKRASKPVSNSTSTAKTAARAKSTATVRRTPSTSPTTVNYPPNPPVNPIPTGPSPSPGTGTKPASNSGCGGCLVWILLIMGLVYFRDNIRQSKIYNDHFKPVVGKYVDGLEQWVKDKNPFDSRESSFQKFRSSNPVFHLDGMDEALYTIKRTDTFSTSSIILTDKTGNERYRHWVSKGTKKIKFKKSIKNKTFKKDSPIRLIQDIDSLLAYNSKLNQRILVQEWSGGPLFYVPVNGLRYYKEIELEFVPDHIHAYDSDPSGSIYLSEHMYESMLKGLGNASIDFSDIPVSKYLESEAEKPTAGNSIEEAEKAYLRKDYESARAIYDEILKEGPFNQSALLGRANTLLMMNKFELALKDYNTIITLSAQKINDGESNETINDAIVYRGVTQYFLGNYEPAMNDLDRILEKGISNADAYLFRGLCKKQLGVEDNGCSDFSRALELGRKDAEEFLCSD